ncbi:hypothetical protein Gpo141_00003653 [Globisporangium polare]
MLLPADKNERDGQEHPALESGYVRLRMVRLDSCRSISRKMRSKYSERAHEMARSGQLNEYERISLGRKMVEVIDDEQSNTESASDSDFSGGRASPAASVYSQSDSDEGS